MKLQNGVSRPVKGLTPGHSEEENGGVFPAFDRAGDGVAVLTVHVWMGTGRIVIR